MGIKPLDKAFKDSGLFSFEVDDAAPRFSRTAVESGSEVSRVEREKRTMNVECLLVRTSADLKRCRLSDASGAVTTCKRIVSSAR